MKVPSYTIFFSSAIFDNMETVNFSNDRMMRLISRGLYHSWGFVVYCGHFVFGLSKFEDIRSGFLISFFLQNHPTSIEYTGAIQTY